MGRTRATSAAFSGVNWPLSTTTRKPATSAPSTGGKSRESVGISDRPTKAITVASETQKTSWKAPMMPRPKGRKTPATMPMTMGSGIAAMIRPTQPVAPSTAMSTPEAR